MKASFIKPSGLAQYCWLESGRNTVKLVYTKVLEMGSISSVPGRKIHGLRLLSNNTGAFLPTH